MQPFSEEEFLLSENSEGSSVPIRDDCKYSLDSNKSPSLRSQSETFPDMEPVSVTHDALRCPSGQLHLWVCRGQCCLRPPGRWSRSGFRSWGVPPLVPPVWLRDSRNLFRIAHF